MAYDPKLKKQNPSRRQFLHGLGGFTLALPLLPSLLPREAWGQTGTFGKRFIAVHNGHCQRVEQWYPDPAKFAWTQKGANAREVALSSIQGPISPILNTAFDPIRNKLLLLGRLDPTSSQPNHNAETILGGGVLSELKNTIDHVIAKKLTGGSPLNLFVRSVYDPYYNGASHVSVANGAYSPGAFNPSSVFSSLFGTSGGGGSNGPDQRVLARDISSVDRVFQQFQALRKSPRLSKSDGERLDKHMELIAQLETKLRASATPQSPTVTCTNPQGPQNSPITSKNGPDYQVVIDQMFDVMEVAIRCGKIRVATLMLHVYDYFSGSVAFIPGISEGVAFHEGIGHAGSPELLNMKLTLNRFFAERVARFLKSLNDVEDPVSGATYLDNSLVLWANDQGALNNTNGHLSRNLPVLLAGSAGGFLKTGRYIDYGPAYGAISTQPGGEEGSYKKGRPYNQLLITILQSMGLQPADYETAGQQGFGAYGANTSAYDYLGDNHRREVLPLVRG